jgi:hypothetical protein
MRESVRQVLVSSPDSLTGLYKTVNHVFDSTAETPPEPSSAAYASTSSVSHPGDGAVAVAPAPGPSFSSPASTGGVRSQPSLDSEAMVDAALATMTHDVDELPSLPLLSDLATGPMHPHPHSLPLPHSHVAAHGTLDIFDAF